MDERPVDWHRQLTETVRILLVHHHRKQRELADALGLSPQAMSRSMSTDRAHRRTWQIPDLIGMARFFQVDAEQLAEGDLTKLLGIETDTRPSIFAIRDRLPPSEDEDQATGGNQGASFG